MSIIFNRVTTNICSIFINRPTKRNAINLEAFSSLKSALEKFEQDDNLYVAILGGVGGNFSAGYDLNEIVHQETAMPKIREIEQMLFPIGTRLTKNKITIAAIDGHAVGFGFELALKCDFRVADRDARMGFLNRRFGIPIMNGGTVILPQLIGHSRAADLVATGKAQLATDALQSGLIVHISDIGCSLGRATNLARCLAKYNQEALLHDLESTFKVRHTNEVNNLLQIERKKSLSYLQQCGPLMEALHFLNGELYRHGSSDMGNMTNPQPEVTL